MSLFDKCRFFNQQVEFIKSQNQFFFLREMNPSATPTVMMKGKQMIMLGSNNYLGLANHPKVIKATQDAISEYGTGACSSRILTGTTSLHTRLEKTLAEFKGTEDALVFSAGFMTMMGTISAITSEGDIIISDELNHASIIEGCRLSKAQKKIYKHNDMLSLEEILSKSPTGANKLIITDGIFSMKGTVANLPEIKKLADKYDAKIMVDDAHGTGVLGATGRGTLEHFNMEGEIDLICGTFSKTLSTIGGFVGSSAEAINFLKLNARSFIFTASPPPSTMATVLACLQVIKEEPELLKKLRCNTDFIKNSLKNLGFRLEDTITPIIPILIGDDQLTFKMAGMLEKEGVIVNPVIPPAVPKELSLIRVSIMATLSQDELQLALDKFKLAGENLKII